jgi:hypothetical protein
MSFVERQAPRFAGPPGITRVADLEQLVQPFFRFLDSNGDGTGTKSFIGDYTTPDEAYIQPPATKVFAITRMIVHIEDSGAVTADSYGALSTLTNGITVEVHDTGGLKYSLTNGDPIHSGAEWSQYCHDVELKTWGAGNSFITARWTFETAGIPILLSGDTSDRLVVTLADNFTGLVDHKFQVQGTRIP